MLLSYDVMATVKKVLTSYVRANGFIVCTWLVAAAAPRSLVFALKVFSADESEKNEKKKRRTGDVNRCLIYVTEIVEKSVFSFHVINFSVLSRPSITYDFSVSCCDLYGRHDFYRHSQ